MSREDLKREAIVMVEEMRSRVFEVDLSKMWGKVLSKVFSQSDFSFN